MSLPDQTSAPTCGDAGGVTARGKPCQRIVPEGGRCKLHPEDGITPPDVGRPPFRFAPDQIRQVEQLAAVMRQSEVADFFGITDRTLRRKFLEDERVLSAYKRGRARAIATLGTDVLRDARGLTPGVTRREQTEARAFYLRTQGNWSERTEVSGPGGAPIPVQVFVETAREQVREQINRMREAIEIEAIVEPDEPNGKPSTNGRPAIGPGEGAE